MIHRQFNPRYLSLEHMQRDLRLAVAMAEPVEQPVYVTTATNEACDDFALYSTSYYRWHRQDSAMVSTDPTD